MSGYSHPVGSSHGTPQVRENSSASAVVGQGSRFESLLQEKLVFSQHAQERMQTRGIHLTQMEANQLSKAIDEVHRKGSRQAAIIMGSDIFIVAPPTRTVITSLESPADGMKVITQVDAVVYVSRTSNKENGSEEASSTRQTASTPSVPHWSLLAMPNADG
ncbi:flagellar operon protein [Sulfobacillus thermosulfidooxidans DSM 9293]|uniref:Flagellar operon protein n=1 Tax=Sulfobacillus thermosulfidooxidans (strain DSM 9293 / VKM B-1269 / AT-1) TaxID=929705 RepID=A0A1W1WE74_SULTA|nr:hypothetical protein [Sulfobacillus thermosulfidooxidans]SMC04584.1 flagellar operon protein [Sulfobacillus thermosulfidooxidans DSM 9293]